MRVASVLFLVLLCLTSRARSQVSVDMRALDSIAPAQNPARVAPAPARQQEPAVAAAPRAVPASHVRRRAVARAAPKAPPRVSVVPPSAARTSPAGVTPPAAPSAAAVTAPIPDL